MVRWAVSICSRDTGNDPSLALRDHALCDDVVLDGNGLQSDHGNRFWLNGARNHLNTGTSNSRAGIKAGTELWKELFHDQTVFSDET